MCMLTLSGEPQPVYSILCDSPTLLPPSEKAAFWTELDFNNLSTENSGAMQRESERASKRVPTPFAASLNRWYNAPMCSGTLVPLQMQSNTMHFCPGRREAERVMGDG